MARYTGPVCRLCRREGEKLFLKGDRCFSNKCAIERREGGPGMHSRYRGRFSEYKLQLREKQKVKRLYGLLEKQFRTMFSHADAQKGVTGSNLLVALESRFDNMVYRSGFAASKNAARQYVGHGHFLVNGKKVKIPSFRIKPGDIISLCESSRSMACINESLANASGRIIPEWLEIDAKNFMATVKSLPSREQIAQPIKEQLIVELYSK